MLNGPMRNESGQIGCPRCNTVLIEKKAPFFLHKEYVGHFE